MPDTPTLMPVSEEIGSLAGKRVYFDALSGNNGDMLIQMGARLMLERTGMTLVDTPGEADAIVMNGGAGITVEWKHGFDAVEKYNRDFPSKELWVLPSTFNFEGVDFGGFFAGRVTPAKIYARERYSFAMLEEQDLPECVEIGIDNDMAFHLRDSDYVRDLQAMRSDRHVLVVERDDKESPTGKRGPRPLSVPWPLKWLVPESLKVLFLRCRRLINQRIKSKHGARTPFALSSLRRVTADYPGLARLPVKAWDVSKPDVCSMSQFGRAVAESACVVTTRLHVGILAHLLGIPAYVKYGARLPHKFKGVYEYSLVQHRNVHVL